MKSIKFQLLLLAMCASASAFVAPATSVANTGKTFTAMQMADVSTLADVAHGVSTFHSTSGLVLAETEAWVQPTALVLGPFLNFLSFAMVRFFLQLCAFSLYFHDLITHFLFLYIIALSGSFILVSRNRFEQSSVEYCRMANGAISSHREGVDPSCFRGRRYTSFLASRLHIHQRNSTGTTRPSSNEDEVWNLN